MNQPIALFPHANITGIWSGLAVVDVNNTSGFFPHQKNGVVAIYTAYSTADQNQNLAYSVDGGYTFTQYKGNPVLAIGSTNFRDPKVFWHAPTSRWVMAVSYAAEFTIGIYTSQTLRHWTHASNFSYHGLLDYNLNAPI